MHEFQITICFVNLIVGLLVGSLLTLVSMAIWGIRIKAKKLIEQRPSEK